MEDECSRMTSLTFPIDSGLEMDLGVSVTPKKDLSGGKSLNKIARVRNGQITEYVIRTLLLGKNPHDYR